MTTATKRRARPVSGFHPRPIGKGVRRPRVNEAARSAGRLLCTCRHEERRHGAGGCLEIVEGYSAIGRRRRQRCRCLRFVEAPFKDQQYPLFDPTQKEVMAMKNLSGYVSGNYTGTSLDDDKVSAFEAAAKALQQAGAELGLDTTVSLTVTETQAP